MKRVLALGVVVVAVVWVLVWWYSDRQIILRRMDRLMEVMTFEGGRDARVMDALALSRLLADEVHLELRQQPERSGDYSREEVESGYQHLRRQAKNSRFHIVAMDGFARMDDRVVVNVRVEASLEMPGIRMLDGEYAGEYVWQQRDGAWLLVGVAWDDP